MVPLKLKRVARETNANGMRQIHFTLHVIFDADVDMINKLRENTSRVLFSTRNIALPAPEDINPAFDEGVVVISDEDNHQISESKNLHSSNLNSQLMSQKQDMAIRKIAEKAGIEKEMVDRVIKGMSMEQAAELIKVMQKGDFKTFGMINGKIISD